MVPKGQWARSVRRAARSARGRVGLGFMAVVVVFAIVGPFFAPDPPTRSLGRPFTGPSSEFWFGTDVLGRDVWSRMMHGGWVLLLMSLIATLGGVAVGTGAGIVAAYLRGKVDTAIMWVVDIFLAFPTIVFALLLVSVVGNKVWLLVVAVGISHVPSGARVMRSSCLDITERDFVKALELQGVPRRRIMYHEILPNLVSPLMVDVGLRLTYSIGTFAALAFLGLSQPPPEPSWGVMINENLLGLTTNPWSVVAPSILIALLAIGTSTFTDAVARAALGIDRESVEAVVADTTLGTTVVTPIAQPV